MCEQTPGPSLQKRMKGGFVSAKGWKERKKREGEKERKRLSKTEK